MTLKGLIAKYCYSCFKAFETFNPKRIYKKKKKNKVIFFSITLNCAYTIRT